MELRDTALATDGYELAVTRFPAEGHAWATLVFAGAMAVPQDFYAPFARFLAQSGIHVLTFDYRGMGASRPHDLAALDAGAADWGEKDLEAMLAQARRAAPELPLAVVGHSLGGQILGLAPSNGAVRAVVNVAAGSGYWRLNDRMPLRLRIFWFLLVPIATPLFGYFPGRALHAIGDLPARAMREWRRWCLDPRYILSEGERARAGFDRVTASIRSYSFSDDDMITRRAARALDDFYRNARIEERHVVPSDLGERRIGHFGFFAERSRANLWIEARDWLRARLVPAG